MRFTIDFFELAFLAEACIPPKPIARAYFWQNLTKVYWYQMTENERCRLFEWMNKNPYYLTKLYDILDIQIFHARFNPENQYMITTVCKRKKEIHRAFKLNDKYYTNHDTFISPEYIKGVQKLIIKDA